MEKKVDAKMGVNRLKNPILYLLATVNLKGSDESLFLTAKPTPPFHQLSLQLLLQNMSNVVELKVGLHCENCIKKILKAIKKIHDIETYDVDTKLNKVTVTGNVTTEEVVKALDKIGKASTKWQGEIAKQLKL